MVSTIMLKIDDETGTAPDARHIAYWRSLGEAPAGQHPLLGSLRWRAPMPPGAQWTTCDGALPDACSASILRVCKGPDLSLYIMLVALLKAYLARVTGEENTAFLSPPYSANDAQAPAHTVCFTGVVASGTDMRSAILMLRRTIVDGYSNQGASLTEVHGPETADKILSDTPMYALTAIHKREESRFRSPLAFWFDRSASQVSWSIRFDASRFRPDLVSELSSNFTQFVVAATADYTLAIDDIDYLSDVEKARIAAFSLGPIAHIPPLRLDAMVSAQALQTPANCALIYRERQLSYADLESQARKAAACLAGMGIGPGKTVALQLASGIDAVVVELAIMMAGAAFCPIGVGEPVTRLRKMLDAVGADLLVSDDCEAIAPPGCRMVSLASLLSAEDAALHSIFPVQDRAYVIFTSGTSGTPKPVAIKHHSIMNAIAWKQRAYQLASSSRVLPLFGYEFDGFVLNVFASLCSASTVILMDNKALRAPDEMVDSISHHGVTHCICTPMIHAALLDHVAGVRLDSLDTVTLAGEAADAALIVRSASLLPHVRLSNEYGPTENAVVSTCHPKLTAETVRVIGRPISNVKVLILDRRLRPVPIGASGEIHLGGPGLARGDAGTADLGFHEHDGERLYRTGDYGCWLPDGQLEYQGRSEAYLKVHGVRVDPDEIRAAVLTCEHIRQAAILANGPAGKEVITAFIVSFSPVSADTLASALRDKLPPNLIPVRVVPVAALPLNAAGKLDRDALHLLGQGPDSKANPGMPDDALTRDLTAIWKDILETEHIGQDESFFARGGHSLSAVRLLARIQETMGVALGLNEIYEANTIRRLHSVIARQDRLSRVAQASHEVPAHPSEMMLSPAQERMLALASEHPLSYNLPVLFMVGANLDIDRLLSAMETVVARHAALRATFHAKEDRWVQRVDDKASVDFTERPLTAGSSLEAAACAAVVPFNLQTGPLVRMVLFSEGQTHRMLLIDFHHIVIDEVALGIVLREFASAYAGGRLPPAPQATYADFAAAQRREQAAESYHGALAAAARYLSDSAAEPLRIPFDHPDTPQRSNSGRVVRGAFAAGLVRAIRTLCRSADVTEFTFFMAVFGLLLHKFTRQTKLVIGAPVSMRTGAHDEACVGLFLNTVPFRLDIRTDAGFLAYLDTVKNHVLEGLGRRQVEFGHLIKALGIERAYAENPLFSVLLHMVDNAVTSITLDGIQASHRPLHTGTSKFDLSLELNLDDGEGSFAFEYPTRRFEETTILRLVDNFMTLLADAVRSPAASVLSLCSMGDAERDKILSWGRVPGCTDAFDEGSLALCFEQQVRKHPARTALSDGAQVLSYAELNARSNRLAHKLIELGVLENDTVGVFCSRSTHMVIAILAVQKARAAHLPLDPYYPATRTGAMLADSGAKILITDQDIGALGFNGTLVDPRGDLSDYPCTNPGSYPGPQSNAYVLYTSGTTGVPKGVMVAQRNIVTLVRRATSLFGLDHNDVWTLFHSVCFDVSVWEMFGALLSGAHLVIVPRELAADSHGLLDLIQKNRVTLLCQPPSAFYLLADTMLQAERPTALRYIILGGEAIKPENFLSWRDDMPAIVNGYGITETTVYSTFHMLSRLDILDRSRSIGRPVPGTYVYILDDERGLCPAGVVGELYIGGLGVGNGYLGSPDLTRQRFVDDPFQAGRILYRSGDLVRWLPDGQIDYLGRADKQLKIRGYRVESSEVEAAMSSYSTIRESAVLAASRDGRTQLMGFFTSDIQEDLRLMRDYLDKRLPDYMVPSRLLQLDKMPLTPNGKVDQARLLAMSAAVPEPAPAVDDSETNSLEKLMAKTWGDIIGIHLDDIGPEDSFFTLGGDSIGANLVVKLLEKQGLPIELLDLFEHPALRDIAELVTARLRRQDDAQPNSYWNAVRAAHAAALLPPAESMAPVSPALSRVSVDLAWNELAPADATTVGDELLLTALCVGLKMSSAGAGIRIALLRSPPGGAGERSVGPAVIGIDDVHNVADNRARVRAGIALAEANLLAWDTVVNNDALAAALECSALVHFSRGAAVPAAGFSATDDVQLPPGCIGIDIDSGVEDGSTTVVFRAHAAAGVSARLQFLAQTFKLAFAEIVDAVATCTPPAPDRVSLDVAPFSDVFFRDCTYQAVLTATRYLGGDLTRPMAASIGIVRRNAHRTHGLRVAVDYIESQAFYDVLADMGLTVRRSNATSAICEQLKSALARGELGVVKLDSFHVKQHGDLYQARHGDHTVLVTGYDTQQGMFDTIDNQPGRNVLYRSTKIGFVEMAAAYESYQKVFNARGMDDDSALFVSRQHGADLVAQERALTRQVLLDTLRLAHPLREEETAAFALLHDDFQFASASEASWSEHAERFMFTIGEVLLAKKLEACQLDLILADATLASPLTEITSHLSVLLAVLSKLRQSGTYSAEKMHAVQARLGRIGALHPAYADAIGRLLEV
ncbi:non-ribosomal peptide synthetase [Massilia rubra]|uniref:non-ribosomal peptide synthetase n=1 Tax=Massilia rubra TaxID=2607910 RepID=UPI0014204D2B|nr:non-ribosomal peptide synthetase [Massilia rubra]